MGIAQILLLKSIRTCPMSFFSQRAFGPKMTSHQRRCDVITSHRLYTTSVSRHVSAGLFLNIYILVNHWNVMLFTFQSLHRETRRSCRQKHRSLPSDWTSATS